jgi:hypothetical protein
LEPFALPPLEPPPAPARAAARRCVAILVCFYAVSKKRLLFPLVSIRLLYLIAIKVYELNFTKRL